MTSSSLHWKKNFRDLGLEFSLGIVEMREGLRFVGLSFVTSSPGQWAEIVAQTLVVFLAGIWSCRGLDRLPGLSGAKVIVERPLILQGFPRELVAIPIINFCLFCHNFWTRNARKSIKPSKDSYCSLESKKVSATKSARLVFFLQFKLQVFTRL